MTTSVLPDPEHIASTLPSSFAAEIDHDLLRDHIMHTFGTSFGAADRQIEHLVHSGKLAPLTVWRCPESDGWPAPFQVYRINVPHLPRSPAQV